DITALVGTSVPVDTGEHEIAASAPGYTSWSTKITVAPKANAAVDVPLLVKAPDAVHEGTLKVTAPPGAEITVDGTRVGVGHYEGKLKASGHTLRVSAPGMRVYQSEVTIAENDARTIDVPLEREVVAAPIEDLPSYEGGLGLATGVKLHGDQPMM